MSRIDAALRAAAERLANAEIGNPSREARRLLAHVLDLDMSRLTLLGGDELGPDDADRFETLVRKRASRVPMSHLLGYRDFWKSRFRVTPDVLDPRPETETLVARALDRPFRRVLDLGVGSGAILVSLLAERSEAQGVGTDISAAALLLAGENAETHGVADRLILPQSDWFDDIGGRYDLIVSNPPYIALDEMEGLSPEVRCYEPRLALTDEADGLTAYRRIAGRAADHLLPGGRVLVEIGPTQAAGVGALFRKAGFATVQTHPDLDGRDRVVEASSPS